MKKILCLLFFCVCGCAVSHNTGSFDGLSARYTGDAQAFAKRTAEELAQRHAPAHTTLALERAPGAFGDALEQALRTSGFAVGAPGSGLGISYTLDVLSEEPGAPLGYVQVSSSDGQHFSFSRAVSETTPYTPPAVSLENTSEPSGETALMPLEHQTQPALPIQPVITAALSSSLAYGVSSPSAVVHPYPVRKAGTAAAIARRNKVAVEDFCRWNHVAKTDMLTKGHEVYLEEPYTVTASAPVASAATSHPTIPPATPPKTPTETGVKTSLTPEKDTAVSSALADMAKASQPPAGAVAATHIPVVAAIPVASTAPSPLTPASATPPASFPATQATPAVVVTPPISPVAQVVPVSPVAPVAHLPEPQWKLQPGSLHDQLNTWAAREGWQIVWNAPDDLDMESSATFSGDFMGAVRQLFEGLYRSGHPLRVTLYQGNKVAEINLQ